MAGQARAVGGIAGRTYHRRGQVEIGAAGMGAIGMGLVIAVGADGQGGLQPAHLQQVPAIAGHEGRRLARMQVLLGMDMAAAIGAQDQRADLQSRHAPHGRSDHGRQPGRAAGVSQRQQARIAAFQRQPCRQGRLIAGQGQFRKQQELHPDVGSRGDEVEMGAQIGGEVAGERNGLGGGQGRGGHRDSRESGGARESGPGHRCGEGVRQGRQGYAGFS